MAPTCTPARGCQPPWVGHRPVGTCPHVSGELGHRVYVHGASEGGLGSSSEWWLGVLRPAMDRL